MEYEQEKLDLAFHEFLHEINAGSDYENSLFLITNRFNVPSEAMQEMMEKHVMNLTK